MLASDDTYARLSCLANSFILLKSKHRLGEVVSIIFYNLEIIAGCYIIYLKTKRIISRLRRDSCDTLIVN